MACPGVGPAAGINGPMSGDDGRTPRLYVEAPLAAGAMVPLDRGQRNYLLNVLRRKNADPVLVFNGRDGEWRARLDVVGRKGAALALAEQTRAQSTPGDLHYLFAPLKQARLDYLVQKAVELGVSRLQPVLTRHGQIARINLDRIRANAIEAAEQCGILALPEIAAPVDLDRLLKKWVPDRLMVFYDEEAPVHDPVAVLEEARNTRPPALGRMPITEREARTPRPGAIQLITSQKAKGLEWDTVVVPFFSRRIHTDEDDFPRIVTLPHDEHAFVAFSKADVPPEKKEALKKAQVREMERLLYVALTRARHTLVLAADRALFAKADQAAPSASLTKWFRADQGEQNEARVAALETKAVECAKTSAYQARKKEPPATTQQFALSAPTSLHQARARAGQFFHRFLPSSFTPATQAVETTSADKWKEIESEFRATTMPSVATQYGLWWHEFVQQIPWKPTQGAWDDIFKTALLNSPDRNRSAKEWKILRDKISSLTDFAGGICDSNAITRVEMPFLWGINERRCLEGVVDLAQFDSAKKRCFILDWKTNQITPDKIDRLRDHYRPQLAAYWKALREMTKTEVEAAIYSTAAGVLVRYDSDELKKEWARLEALSPEQSGFAAKRSEEHTS